MYRLNVKEKNSLRLSKLPFLIFLITLLVLQYASYATAFNQISRVCTTFLRLYLTIYLFNFIVSKDEHKRKDKKHNREKRSKFLFKPMLKLKPLKNKNSKATEKEKTTDEFESDDCLLSEKEREHRKDLTGNTAIKALYIVMQLYTVISLVVSSFGDTVSRLKSNVSFLSVGVLAIIAIAFFSLGKWNKMNNTKEASTTVSSMLNLLGSISAVYAVVLSIQIILKIDCSYIILWFYRIFTIYIAFCFVFGIVVATIKGKTLQNFNYDIYYPTAKRKKRTDIFALIEENTGISLKSLWSLRFVLRILPALILGIFFLLVSSTCIYKVEPYQQALKYRFGTLNDGSVESQGIHFKLPWPIDKIELHDVHRVKCIPIGYESSSNLDNLWTQSHGGEEYKLLTGGGNELLSSSRFSSCGSTKQRGVASGGSLCCPRLTSSDFKINNETLSKHGVFYNISDC